MSKNELIAKSREWLDKRLGLEWIFSYAAKKTVPIHRHSVWYYFGGMALFFFKTQVVTGLLLLLYYRPGEREAYESIRFIMSEVPFGWLIRSLHHWSAGLMIGAVFVHFFSTMIMKAYRKPREFIWITGIIMLLLVLGFGFTGYVCPWNEVSFFATRVGSGFAKDAPFGDLILRFIRGGENVTGVTLSRLFGWHVCLIPLIFLPLMGLHLLFVAKLGSSVPVCVERENKPIPAYKFFWHFVLRDIFSWTLLLIFMLWLCTFHPTELGKPADMTASAPPGIQPEWYFLWMYQTLKFLPASLFGLNMTFVINMTVGAFVVFLILLPFIDRASRRNEPSPVFTIIGVICTVYFFGMTIMAIIAHWSHFGVELVHLLSVIGIAVMVMVAFFTAWTTHVPHKLGDGK